MSEEFRILEKYTNVVYFGLGIRNLSVHFRKAHRARALSEVLDLATKLEVERWRIIIDFQFYSLMEELKKFAVLHTAETLACCTGV